jgi:two-component system, NarL family, sensor kinase
MSITLIVALSSFGVFLLIVSMVIFFLIHDRKIRARDVQLLLQKNEFEKHLLNSVVEVATKERIKIAHNLHDDLGMTLHAMLNFIRIAKKNANNQQTLNDALTTTEGMLHEAHQQIRNVTQDIFPLPLGKFSIVECLQYLTDHINEKKIILAEFSEKNIIPLALNESVIIHLYYMMKEITNNIIKHADATRLKIGLDGDEKMVNICVSHNGNGIADAKIKQYLATGKGIGLKSILGRAQIIDATVNYTVFSSFDSQISIVLPHS